MGLAASQARLLTITARKADCEFLSMSLSHQKLSLSRDMENVSSEYQKALNQTKLVYDYYGSGDKSMALSYGLLMTPSIYNDYYPKLVTDPTNRVILNGAYASAARAAGIPIEGLLGTPSSDVRNKFIEALVGSHIISAQQAASIEAIPYGNTIGLGDTVNVTSSITEVTFDEFLELLEAHPEYNNLGKNEVLSDIFTTVNEGNIGAGYSARLGTPNGEVGYYDAAAANAALCNVTLSDLLTGDGQYYISAESGKGELTPASELEVFQTVLVSKFVPWLGDAFSAVLGGVNANETAIQYALDKTYDLLNPSDNFRNWRTKEGTGYGTEAYGGEYVDNWDKKDKCEYYDDECRSGRTEAALGDFATCHPNGKMNENDYFEWIAKDANKYIGFLYTQELDGNGFHKDRNDTSQVQINLNNIAKVFLTAFAEYIQGVQNTDYNYAHGLLSDAKLFDANHNDMILNVFSEANVDNNDNQLYANFYDAMFNAICLHGWTENDRIDDNEYMSEMLKNGMGYISSISDDGFYYQGNYSTDKCIVEVADDDAIARAEAKYNTEKAKIEHKEDTIDLKMKNLDTEISSLTTEYDTTKQVITKAIEKSFKRYEA